MLISDLSDDDEDLWIQLLKNVEIKYSALRQKHKGKKFNEIYKELTRDKKKNS